MYLYYKIKEVSFKIWTVWQFWDRQSTVDEIKGNTNHNSINQQKVRKISMSKENGWSDTKVKI